MGAKLTDPVSPQEGAGHWYNTDGQPVHRVPTVKGDRMRNTTIRDARKMDLTPSVTTILKDCLSKPQLERWKMDQVAKTAFENRPMPGETQDGYKSRISNIAYQSTREAADFGTYFHKAIEEVFDGKEPPQDLVPFIEPVLDWKNEKNLDFIEREKVVVDTKHGFAGTVDIVAQSPKGVKMICDYKTKKTSPKYPITPFFDQILQISAYAVGYWGLEAVEKREVYGANLFVSSTEPGRFEVAGYKPDQIFEAWETFKAICVVWRKIKKYDPRQN